MSTPDPRATRLTEAFYDWELRGRGWDLCPYPVALEPPFRPFLQHDAQHVPAVDDGRVPTRVSRLLDGLRKHFAGERPVQTPDAWHEIEEPLPEPGPPSQALAELALLVPPDLAPHAEVNERLLMALSALRSPVSFEVIGTADAIRLQLACRAGDASTLQETLAGFLPDVVVAPMAQPLEEAWHEAAGAPVVVDFGLSNEFFLPLRSGGTSAFDPLTPVFSGLAGLAHGELAVLQVLAQPVAQPWTASILRAVSDGRGGCFFADAPELLALAREKTAHPLFAVVIRLGARCASEERAWELLLRVNAAFAQLARPGANELIPLANEGYAAELHLADLLNRTSHRSGMILNAPELASLLHAPAASARSRSLVRLDTRTKAAPEIALGHALGLGENTHHGETQRVGLSPQQRVNHVYVIGASGTGKSTFLLDLTLIRNTSLG